MEKLLNMEEVAADLRVPLSTLRFWRVQGIGPRGFKVGRRVMFTEAEVRRWLADQQASPT